MNIQQFHLNTCISEHEFWKTGIYKITNNISGKVYIGQTTTCFLRRWLEHQDALEQNKHWNIHLQRAFNKYGSSVFLFEIVEIVNTKDINIATFNQKEAETIASFYPHVYNIKSPPQTSYIIRKKCKRLKGHSTLKQKLANKKTANRRDIKEQFVERMSNYWKDHNNKAKQSKLVKQYFANENNRQKASNTMKRKLEDNEYKEKMVLANQTKWNKASKQKMSQSTKKRFASDIERTKMSIATKLAHQKQVEIADATLCYFYKHLPHLQQLSIRKKREVIDTIALLLSNTAMPTKHHEARLNLML